MRYLSFLVVAVAFFMSCDNAASNSNENDNQSFIQEEFNNQNNQVEAQQENVIMADPWSTNDLMEPSLLAQKIEENDMDDIMLISIGFDNVIKGAEGYGPAGEVANMERLRETLNEVDKNQEIVIYCGCCPFASCPNVRPAFNLLQTLGFENAKLLNLRENIKVDWIDKGYPIIVG